MRDLHQILAEDPRGYSAADLDEIIKLYREKRHLYQLGNMKGGSTKPLTEKQKEVKSLADTMKLDL
jgi:hypothetical protein